MPSAYEHYELNKRFYASFEDYAAKLKPTASEYIRNHRRPNYFYYAVPEGMIQPEEVPEYAGLIWILKEYSYIRQSYVIKKQAPQLHKQKYKDAELNLGEKFYYNWQSDRLHRKEAQKETETVRRLLKEELESKGQDRTYHQMEVALKCAEEDRDNYKKWYAEKCRDQNIDRMIIRRMRSTLLERDPGFDYAALERECEHIYGIK